jgi:LysR family cys regulon transcriptional activator
MYEFIEAFAPHLTREMIDRALQCSSKLELEALFDGVELPVH